MSAVVSMYNCAECGSPLIASKSGSVCPSGHGKLGPVLPTNVRRRNHAIIGLDARDAKLLNNGNYALGQDLTKQYKLVRKIIAVTDNRPEGTHEGNVFGLSGDDGTHILELAPVRPR